MNDKTALRIKYKKLRDQISEEAVDEMSLEIANKSLKLPIWDQDYYHIFLSISEKREVDTSIILNILQGKDKSVVISKTDFTTHAMEHFLLQENTILKISKYGIPEPISGLQVSPATLDVVFVPLLAFDLKGNRLGYGKGFYDRFLRQCRPDTKFVGLSFFDPEPHIPSEETDVPLHFCVTPQNIYDFSE